MSPADPLAELDVARRNELESLLMEFDLNWTPELLAKICAAAEANPMSIPEKMTVSELVKIDMQRRWGIRRGQLLEYYLDQYPILGMAEDADTDLIVAEFEARRMTGETPDTDSYRERFPRQFDAFKRRVTDPSESRVQASIDTSRIDEGRDTATEKNRRTASDLPVRFGRYRILRKLGSGAMGTVYLAHDSQLDRKVALKTPSFDGPDTGDLVTRFYREARTAAKIQHRNICPVYDVGEIDDRHFISMAFVEGRCMSDYIKPDKLPPQKTSAVLIHRIASALAEAHRYNVVHRDLKPSNIMIDTKREPIVMDFGLARQLDVESRVTRSGVAVGTPAYMSPEQIRGDQDDVGPTSDVYSLGVILFELLTGRLPFRGPIAKVVYGIVHDTPPKPSEISPDVDPDLEAICIRMMDKDRQRRFQSMDDVASELKRYLKGDQGQRQPNSGQSVSERLASTESQVVPVTETAALNAFFANQSTSLKQDSRADLQPSQIEVISVAPSKRSSSRRKPFFGKLLLTGFGGTAVLAAMIIILSDGSRFEIPDGKTTVIETNADGSLKQLTVQPDSSTTARASRSSAPPAVSPPGKASLPPANINHGISHASFDAAGRITITTGGDASQLAVSPDGRRVVATGVDSPGRFTIWDTESGDQLAQFDDFDRPGLPTKHVVFSPDGRSLIYSTGDLVRVVSASDGKAQSTFEFPAAARLVVFPVRTWALATYFERNVGRKQKSETPQRLRIWDWKTGQVLTDIPSPESLVYHPAVSPDERFVTLAQEHYHIRYTLDVAADEVNLNTPTRFESTSRVRGPLVFAPKGDYVATNLKNGSCMSAVLNLQTGRIINRLGLANAEANNGGHVYGCDLAFTPDGKHVAMADHTGRAALWNVETGAIVAELGNFEKTGNHLPPSVVVSSDGKVIIGGHTADGRITIQRIKNRKD